MAEPIRLTYDTPEIQEILDSVAGKYEKPSGGIPSTDLASGVQTSLGKADTAYQKPGSGIPSSDMTSAVQTSLGKADTALQSFTETDPIFSASAAAGIDSDDITNWNGKTSNIGTITSVKMNGSTVSSSGEADLGTVITSHQDISGKADKVSSATNGNFAALDSNGNLTDSGHKHSDYLTSFTETDPIFSASAAAGIQSSDITSWDGKSDKVSGATNGNFAALDSNGNLTDSGHKHSDYLTSFTETDPIFSASAAAGIQAADITAWDGKVSSVVLGSTSYSPVSGVVTLPALPFGTYIGTGTGWGASPGVCYLRTNYFSGGVVPQKEGDLVYSTSTRNLHRCGTVTWDSGQNCYKTTPTLVCYVSGFAGAFSNLSNTPTTLSGYGITDAKIETGTITLGSNTITPLTSHQDISGKADKVSSATNGNFAGLDANGNLTDSGKKASDFLPLTGGDITLEDYSKLNIKTTASGAYSVIKFFGKDGSTMKALGWLGFQGVDTPVMWDSVGFPRNLYHSGNSNKSDVAWACSTLATDGDVSIGGNVAIRAGKRVRFNGTGGVTYSFDIDAYQYGGLYIKSTNSSATGVIIDNSGNVGVNASTASQKLYVNGNILASGTITPGSDSRIKDNQKEISSESAFAVIEKLKPKTWVWNEKSNEKLNGKTAAGLVAQEVKEVLPEAVTVSENGAIKDFHSLNYNTIQGYEIAAIKGLIEENKALKSEVAELKEKLDAIMEMLK